MTARTLGLVVLLLLCHCPPAPAQAPATLPGSATRPVTQPAPRVAVTGQLDTWHTVTLDLQGPQASETGTPNPFTDLRMTVTFTHPGRDKPLVVPGYFAADGDAANSSADKGNVWRAHLLPDRPGEWTYAIAFRKGPMCAVDDTRPGTALAPYDGATGTFNVKESKVDRDSRNFHDKGLLAYVGRHHLRFAGSGDYFIKFGPDSPETLLAFDGFDNTQARSARKAPLKSYAAHATDWRPGDPRWQGKQASGDSRNLIGALNYLASAGCNAVSFIPYNAGGDGDNVWPMANYDDKLRYDCSKLDQWRIVFAHAQSRGLMLHFKLQETENDNQGQALDAGATGPERKLYLRELVARYAHLPALEWNIGEENDQPTEQQLAMMNYLASIDPYQHPIVIHTYPNQQDKVYTPLLGKKSPLAGASLQTGWKDVHRRTLKWVRESEKADKPWVVANDEQGPAGLGVPPDKGYKGFEGRTKDNYDLNDIRRQVLYGNLMAGGAGVMYYFGYQLPENDLKAEDFRSRDQSWKFGRVAVELFAQLPFQDMSNQNRLVGNLDDSNARYCLAKPGELYVVYAANPRDETIDLTDANGTFEVTWYNPRAGGKPLTGPTQSVRAGGVASLGIPPQEPDEDWIIIVRKRN